MIHDAPSPILRRDGYTLAIDEDFSGSELDSALWIPYYLPQWSSRAAAAARYAVRDHTLRLLIEADQAPWCPEFDGWLRVSSLQTGVFAGPLGSGIGQHRYRKGLVVREEQPSAALFTPQYGLFELHARALDDPSNMVAFWMIGYEDVPHRAAEICVLEIFGRDVRDDHVSIGMGLRSFGDDQIRDDFTRVTLAIDARDSHSYAAEWTETYVAFYVDERLVKVVRQSPAYPMQFMLGIYELADEPALRSPNERYPKEFVVERFQAYAPAARAVASP